MLHRGNVNDDIVSLSDERNLQQVVTTLAAGGGTGTIMWLDETSFSGNVRRAFIYLIKSLCLSASYLGKLAKCSEMDMMAIMIPFML